MVRMIAQTVREKGVYSSPADAMSRSYKKQLDKVLAANEAHTNPVTLPYPQAVQNQLPWSVMMGTFSPGNAVGERVRDYVKRIRDIVRKEVMK